MENPLPLEELGEVGSGSCSVSAERARSRALCALPAAAGTLMARVLGTGTPGE